MGARLLVAAVGITIAAAPVRAQRREGKRATSVLEVRLPVCTKFGEAVIPARTYRLTLGARGFALADPNTMVLIATVPVTEAESATAVEDPEVDVVIRSKERIEIVLRAGARIYTAVGVPTASVEARASSVELASKRERDVKGGGPEKRTATQLVARATKRYMSGIKHCADKAHRGRWGTDDHRFINCVCPIVLRWKMPPIDAPLLMHWPLARGRHGFSFHVTKKGKVTSCRVWAGAKPPEPEPKPSDEPEAKPSDAPEPDTTSAPQPKAEPSGEPTP